MSIDLPKGPISHEAAAALSEEYALIFEREHHNHPLYVDEHGSVRWERDPTIDMLFEYDALDLNKLFFNGAKKNDPRVRDLYRKMGYSLYGYWEVFYWDWNNEDWDEYNEPEMCDSNGFQYGPYETRGDAGQVGSDATGGGEDGSDFETLEKDDGWYWEHIRV